MPTGPLDPRDPNSRVGRCPLGIRSRPPWPVFPKVSWGNFPFLSEAPLTAPPRKPPVRSHPLTPPLSGGGPTFSGNRPKEFLDGALTKLPFDPLNFPLSVNAGQSVDARPCPHRATEAGRSFLRVCEAAPRHPQTRGAGSRARWPCRAKPLRAGDAGNLSIPRRRCHSLVLRGRRC